MASNKTKFARETRIRDFFSDNLSIYRPSEVLVRREVIYDASSVRADMRTVDKDNLIREWEFKIKADYSALGQILTYVSLIRRERNFKQQVRGVIAAFEISTQFEETVEIMNLGIELVRIPNSLRAAGNIPSPKDNENNMPPGIFIPNANNLTPDQQV